MRRTGAPTLLLVPTELERRALEELGGFPPGLALVETCGFGPIAASARAAALLALLRPARAVLIGIAGTYDPVRHPVGTAARCGSVAIDGLETCGFEQAPGIGERIDLADGPARLLTVLSPSRSLADAASRRARFAEATHEDMEGFGVALACALGGTPLSIVRGASNVAGDTSREGWRIRDALAAARIVAIEVLGAR